MKARSALINMRVFCLPVAIWQSSVGGRSTLLEALIQRRDRVVPKQELLDVVWPGLIVEENNLQVHVMTLRKVLGADSIVTVSGRGYRFALAPDAASRQPASQRPGSDGCCGRRPCASIAVAHDISNRPRINDRIDLRADAAQ